MINYKPVIELIASRVLRCILQSILTLYMYLISLVIMYQYPQTIIIQVNNNCFVLLYNIVVPCELYLIRYMYLQIIYLILYLSECHHLVMFRNILISENHLNDIKTIIVYNGITLYELNWKYTELLILYSHAKRHLLPDCCVCDSWLILKLFNCTISCTCRCYIMCLCVLNNTSVPTLDYLNCLLMLYVFISMYVLVLHVLIDVSLNKQQTMPHIVTLNRHANSLLLLYDINMIVYTCMHIVNYIIIVCNYSLVNAYMYTSRFMSYQMQDSLTLSFGRIVLVVLVLLNANIFIYDGG